MPNTNQDELDTNNANPNLIFWKHLTFRDLLVLALIVSNIAFYFKIKVYEDISLKADNGNKAANFLIQQINAQQAK